MAKASKEDRAGNILVGGLVGGLLLFGCGLVGGPVGKGEEDESWLEGRKKLRRRESVGSLYVVEAGKNSRT